MSWQVQEWVFEHSETVRGERCVLLALAAAMRPDGTGWIVIEDLARRARVSRRTAQRALRSAEAAGEIEILTERGGGPAWPGRFRPPLYRFVGFLEQRGSEPAEPSETTSDSTPNPTPKGDAGVTVGGLDGAAKGCHTRSPRVTPRVAKGDTGVTQTQGFKDSKLSLTSTSEEPPDAEPAAGERDQSQIEAMSDALAEAVGWTQIGRAQRSDLTAAARDLISQGATTEGVRHAPRRWAEMGRTHQLTPRAIARWWSQLAPDPEPEITEGTRKLREFEARVGREATYDELNAIWGIDD